MYENHWHLNGKPFENWRDADFYYPSEFHQTALLKIRYAIESHHGLVLLSGDSGMGKTLICDRLLDQLDPDQTVVARLIFPSLDGNEFLSEFADRMTGQPEDAAEPPRRALRRIEEFVNQSNDAGRRPVVVFDEAQGLVGPEQLEILRLLMNLGDCPPRSDSAWTLLLAGQSPMLGLVQQNRAIEERVAANCTVPRFSGDQTAAYLAHRLAACGADSDQIFTPEAIDTLHIRSSGIPRRLNRLADLALMLGFADDLSRLDAQHIDGVHRQTTGAPPTADLPAC